jgi:hypothetical protein
MCRADCHKPIVLRLDYKERVTIRDGDETLVENEKLKDENSNLRFAFDELLVKYNKILDQISDFAEKANALQVSKLLKCL